MQSNQLVGRFKEKRKKKNDGKHCPKMTVHFGRGRGKKDGMTRGMGVLEFATGERGKESKHPQLKV